MKAVKPRISQIGPFVLPLSYLTMGIVVSLGLYPYLLLSILVNIALLLKSLE